MIRLGGSRAGSYAGYMTFHRVDANLIKSPSVGIPWRTVFVLAGIAGLAVAGYWGFDQLPAGAVTDHAVQLLSGSDGIALLLASDLRLEL